MQILDWCLVLVGLIAICYLVSFYHLWQMVKLNRQMRAKQDEHIEFFKQLVETTGPTKPHTTEREAEEE